MNKLSSTSKPILPRRRLWLFRMIAIILPIILILLLELLLRIFNYGPNLNLWVPYANRSGFLTVNPKVALRYFPKAGQTSFGAFDVLAEQKPADTRRIFILGGSTVAGFPYYNNGSFPRYLDLWLKELYPQANLEVINLGMTAVNSFTVREFARECLSMEPDLLMIYSGHNEFYGALGSGSKIRYPVFRSRGFILFMQKLRHWKMYQLVLDLTRRIGKSPPVTATNQTLMAHLAAEQQIELNSQIYQQTVKNFTDNITDILKWYGEAGIPVLLGNLVSNLRDQTPFVSLPVVENSKHHYDRAVWNFGQGAYDTALLGLKSLLDENPANAHLHFNLGQCYYNLSNYDSARYYYELARDFDMLRFRASGELNNVIDSLASDNNVCIAVRVDSIYNANSEGGIPGNDLFLEHLHPNIKGYQLMAQVYVGATVANNLLKLGRLDRDRIIATSDTEINRLTALDQQIADYQIEMLTAGWPFQSKGGATNLSMFKPQSKIEEIAIEFLAQQINDWQAHLAMAFYYRENQQVEAAIQEGRWLATAYPHNWKGVKLLGQIFLEAALPKKALPVLIRVTELTDDHFSYLEVGKIYMQLRKARQALNYLEKAKTMNTGHQETLYHLSGAYLMTGNRTAAQETLEQLVKINPEYPNARDFFDRIKTL